MRWVTRAGARLDRATMIWFIRRFVDPAAEIVFLPEGEVIANAEATGAIAFHHPQTAFRHTGFRTGLDALLAAYPQHIDPALTLMSLIHRGAETTQRDLTPWSAGVRAMGSGLRMMHEDDAAFVDAVAPFLDALYRFCQDQASPTVATPAGRE